MRNVVYEQVRHKSGCSHRKELEAGNFGFKKKNCTIRRAKTKALISSHMQIVGFLMRRLKCGFKYA